MSATLAAQVEKYGGTRLFWGLSTSAMKIPGFFR